MSAGFVAGAGLSAVGQYQANQDKAQAEAQNASFYREQAAFAQDSGDRDLSIFNRKSQIEFGEQVNAFAKAGNQSADAIAFLAEEKLNRNKEAGAIKEDRDFNVRLANLRAGQADRQASDLSSFSYNFNSIGGNLLSMAGKGVG